MSDQTYATKDISADILTRATALHAAVGFPSPLHGPCQLDKVFDWASHQPTRVKVTMTLYQGHPIRGLDNAMAWFRPESATFTGHPTLSARLTTEGADTPTSEPVGWLQIHRDMAIWFGWRTDTGGLDECYTDWSGVRCSGGHLSGKDQNGRMYDIKFELYRVGFAPDWPDWLLAGEPADTSASLGIPV
jgi:hypothetical protein